MLLEWLRRNRNVVVPLGLFVFSIGWLSYGSYTERKEVSLFSKAIIAVNGLGQSAVTDSIDGVDSFWSRYIYLRGVVQENERLKEELRILKSENYRLVELEKENERLRKFIGFPVHEEIKIKIPAETSGPDSSAFNETMAIKAGSLDGIVPHSNVITYESALVGQILDEPGSAIGPKSSFVLLITDRRSKVSVLDQRSRAWGVLEGRLEGSGCELTLKDRHADVRPGDMLISSGSGGVFMKGWPVGTVTEIVPDPDTAERRIYVDPVADFSKLEEVIVIPPQEIQP